DGLKSQYKGSKPTVLTPQVEARILDWTRKPPPAGITQWSTRTLAKVLGVHYLTVARTWKRAGLQPHRMERYVRSNDPAFEQKAAAIIGLYLDPPEHAVVFCVGEKTAIQALDRRFRRSIDVIRFCRCPRVGRSATGSSTSETGRSRSTRLWRRRAARSSGRPPSGTRAMSSSPSSSRSSHLSPSVR